jgi:alpha-tubulin suppressor-like RCC1 family protein
MAGLSNGSANQDYTEIDFALYLAANGTLLVYENGANRGQVGTYAAGDRLRVQVLYGKVLYFKNGAWLYSSSVVPRYPLRVDTSLYTTGATLTDVTVGNLTWTNGADVQISGDSIVKTGTNAAWDAGAISTNTIESGDGFLEFTATETDKSRIAGLASGNTDNSLSDVEFGIQLRDDGIIEIFESGTSRGTVGGYLSGDRLRVELTGGVVRYYANSSLLYTSGVTPVYPLRADSSLYSENATLTNVILETLVWTNASNLLVQGSSLTKTGSDGWNATASSSNSIQSGDGWLEFTAIETDKERVLGLKSTGSASSYTDIDFAIDLKSTGTIEIYELGTSRGSFGAYTLGDRLRIEVEYGIVRYLRNGVLLYTSSTAPTYPLHAETAAYSAGATLVDVAMGDLVWTNGVKVKVLGNSLIKTGTAYEYDAGAISSRAISSGYVEIVANFMPTYQLFGLGKGDSNQGLFDINYGFHMESASVYVSEGGTLRTGAIPYVIGDRLRISIESGTVKYYKNGTLLYTSGITPTLPLRVDTSIRGSSQILFNVVLVGDAVADQLGNPGMSPAPGTYTAAQSVTLSHSISGTTIRYTTDGTDPDTSSPIYSSPIAVSVSTTIKAKAWRNGYDPSGVQTGVYTLKVPMPSISPGTNTYNVPQSVTMSHGLAGTTIFYTNDGTTPTPLSTQYTSPIPVDQPITLKAIASKPGWINSDVRSATYTMKVGIPSFSVAGGSYSGAQVVTVTTTTPSATLRYTLDGSNPTPTSPEITGAITVDHSNTLKVIGYRSGWTTSDQKQATYMITLGTVDTPVFGPPAGTYMSSQTVSISSTTAGATIRYTTDGTEPTVRSKIYSSPVLLETTTQLKARAFKADHTASTVASALYVIDWGTVDTPRLSPGSGTYAVSQTVTVTTETSGATIHYTTNGNDPTESDPTVASGGTLIVETAKSLKVKAWKSGLPESGVGRGDYHVTGAVTLGGNFSLALKADGTVWSWGNNANGQLGIGSTGGTHTVPAQITSTSGFVAISAGANHVLAIKSDGTVWAWGLNGNGQLGDGSSTTRTSPVQVNTLTNVIAVSAGQTHSLALKSDGTVWEWGFDRLTTYGASPVQVSLLKGVTAIATKRNHSFALQSDGELSGALWAWGYNDLAWDTSFSTGIFGDGTTQNHATPVRVIGMTGVVKFSTGYLHSLALKEDGSVWGWGANAYGYLGDGTSTARNVPVQVVKSINPADPILSLGAATNYSILGQRKKISGQSLVWAWGYNGNSSFGVPTINSVNYNPVLSLMTGAFDTAVGEGYHVAGLHLDGTVWMWGYNSSGQLGDGTATTRITPAAISGFSLADNAWLLTDDDEDGLEAWVELQIGSDPGSADTNGDGISDGAAFGSDISTTNSDMDGDGVTNVKERERSSDPLRADTDDDGTADGADCFPQDATRSTCPSANPSDTTPPVITLTRPTNATLTGSEP